MITRSPLPRSTKAPAGTAPILLAACLLTASAVPGLHAADGEPLGFNQHIRPILSENCFACHGFDQHERKAGLRLDTAEGAYAGGDQGAAAIVPGDPDASLVWQRITATDPADIMPPPEAHRTLSDEQKELVRQWIAEGAEYEEHWAFVAPRGIDPPEVEGREHPIDRFLEHRLQREGLEPGPRTDRATLIRRASFALTGLPPTAEEVVAFESDPAADAWERLIDRLLESPHHGEEMARHWLDVARYGDTHGLHLDNERQMWAYRDWVVEAFNRNLPFDQFTIEQIAGDLLPEPTRDQLVATGFNRCNVTTGEGGSINEEWIFRYAVDRASTVASAWMGLTASCAVCHDHKYDPISAREFYQLYAFFHSNADPAMDGNSLTVAPVLKLATDEQETRLAELAELVAEHERQLEEQVAGALADYTDPAELDPAPEVQVVDHVWMDDDFPAGAQLQFSGSETPLTWVHRDDGPVFSGERSIVRQGADVAQDFYNAGAEPLQVPVNGRFYVHVRLDGEQPPGAVMIQFHTNQWRHRAVWGDASLIPFGQPDSPEKFHAGELPPVDEWTRLEVDAAAMGLNPGDRVSGFAFTLHGGRAWFDLFGVEGRIDPASDVSRSFLAWRRQAAETIPDGLPDDLKPLVANAPDEEGNGQLDEEQHQRLLAWWVRHTSSVPAHRETLAPLVAGLDQASQERRQLDDSIPRTYIWRDLDQPRPSRIKIRGEYDQPGDEVQPGTPDFLPPLQPANDRANRLDLARWLVSPDHPLTARVTVNRFWQQFFGAGLVSTPDDFGSQGGMPSHPELLDWLALWFVENDWDTRALVRLLLTSEAFQRESAAPADHWRRDPDNRLLARGPRFRLDAEQLRDNALFVSGLINLEQGGPGVRPYQPPQIWEPVGFVGSNTREYVQDTGPALYRRSLYVFLKRTAPPPFMSNFDAPDREMTCSARERSNTPLQALQLMNDVQHFEAARALAERLLREGGDEPAARLEFAWRTVLARAPEPVELERLAPVLERHLERYRNDPEAAAAAIDTGDSAPDPALDPVELAAWTLMANLLLNLDETVTRN